MCKIVHFGIVMNEKYVKTLNVLIQLQLQQGNLKNVGATHLLNTCKLNTNITIDLKINKGCFTECQ